jgi:hypothetical protein
MAKHAKCKSYKTEVLLLSYLTKQGKPHNSTQNQIEHKKRCKKTNKNGA